MSYPELSVETINECSRAAFAYSTDCYCVFNWSYADYLPRPMYRETPTKWLTVSVFRCLPLEATDRHVLAVSGLNAPELLRRLREALGMLADGITSDPTLLASDHQQQVLRSALGHPMLVQYQLLKALGNLLPRLPRHEAQALTTELQEAITQRSREVYNPPEGNGWIATAPQTTEELKPWAH
jgi:hypothetical protein